MLHLTSKKTMKNTIILTCLLAFGLSSCKDTFLEVNPETALSTVTFYKTQSDFEQGVNATYVPLRTLYNDRYYLLNEMHSDNTYYARNILFGATEQQEDLADHADPNGNGLSTNTHVLNSYRQSFLMISYANQVLSRIDAATISDGAVKANIKGQAQFLRAFAYFNLVRYFGKAPVQIKPVVDRQSAAAPLGSSDELLKIVTDDLTGAIAGLYPRSKQQLGRATSGAAKTLLADVLIWKKDWAGAEKLLKEVVGEGSYSLISKYENAFSNSTSNKNNSESIFEVQFKEGSDGYAGSFMYNFMPRPMLSKELVALSGTSNPQDLTGEGNNVPTPDIIDAYEPGDLRKDASIGLITLSSSLVDNKVFPYIKKFVRPHALHSNHGMNFPVYRYAEVLLMLAESLNEQGKTAEAATFLNQVRSRAGLAATTASSQAEFRTAVFKERRVELAFENKRWFDLVRSGTAVETITAYGKRIVADPQKYYYPKGAAPRGNAFSNIRTTYALPADEAALNPNIK